MHIYDKKLNGTIQTCEVCGLKGNQIVQHHVLGRRYDDRCIWVCTDCHAHIHANPQWAYANNYLLQRGTNMKKEKKIKTCSHSLSIFDKRLGYIRCHFCGQKVESIRFGGSKASSPKNEPRSAPKKMGFDDKLPSHVIKAQKLRNRVDTLKALMLKTKDKQKKEVYAMEYATKVQEMQALQREYNLE